MLIGVAWTAFMIVVCRSLFEIAVFLNMGAEDVDGAKFRLDEFADPCSTDRRPALGPSNRPCAWHELASYHCNNQTALETAQTPQKVVEKAVLIQTDDRTALLALAPCSTASTCFHGKNEGGCRGNWFDEALRH